MDVDTIIESIFSTTGDARLPQPVPLSQMIDLLVDFWEVRLERQKAGGGAKTKGLIHLFTDLNLLFLFHHCRRTGSMTRGGGRMKRRRTTRA